MPNRRREKKSKYTSDRNMPGAFEGETVTRRNLMNLWANGAGGIAAAAFTLPALGFAIAPIFTHQAWSWQAIGTPADFNETTYLTKVIVITPGIGEAGNSIAYVRQRNPRDRHRARGRVQPLGRPVGPLHAPGLPGALRAAAERFICPCHGGVYDFRGMVAGGPPVRPLDRFYTRLNDGLVEIGPRYSVNSELQRFSPRFPGEPLDGIGQYLYPAQFAGPKKP